MHEEALLLQFNCLHFWKLPLPEIGSDDLQTISRAPHSTPRISAPHDFGTATYWRQPLPAVDPAEMDQLMAGRGAGGGSGWGAGLRREGVGA
ncbi:unnamed protein product [Lampetra planeri]